MELALIFFLGGAVIFAWFYLWSRQREELGHAPGIEEVLSSVPAASTDDALLVSKEHGQLVYVNDLARSWLSMNGESPNLEYAASMVSPADSFLSLFGGEGQASFQVGPRWVEASSHRIPNGPEIRTVVVMRELGAKTQNPQALDLSQAMTVINRIGETVNASMSVEQVLQTLLSIVRSVIPADAGEICLWDESGTRLKPRGYLGDSAYVLLLDENGGTYQPGEGITGWIVQQRKPVLVTDRDSYNAIPPKLKDSPYQSYVGVPLLLGDQLLGTFELAAVARSGFAQRDMALLQAIGQQLAISIYNAQLYTEQAQHIEQMANLQDVVQQAGRDEEDYARAVYKALHEHIARLAGVEMCGILLYNEARQALVPEPPFYGVPDQITRNYQIPLLPNSPQQEIWENHQSWYTNDLVNEPLVEALRLLPLAELTGVYNTALVPMTVGDQRIGIVQASNKRGEGFTPRDIQNLRILAAQAAVIVENIRIYQREQSQETELLGLQEITYAISASSDESEFYAEITARIARLMDMQMCGILLYDEAQQVLAAKPPFYGVDEALMSHYVIPLQQDTMLLQAWLEEDYWYTNNVSTDRLVIEAGLEPLAAAVGVTQTMFAVLAVGGRRLGVVQVSNKNNGAELTEKDARLLMIYAAQAAALIENARLVREMQRRADEAETLRDEAEGLRQIAEMAGSILTVDEPFTPVLAEIGRLMHSPIVFINVLEQHSSNLVTYPRYVHGIELDQPLVQDSYAPGFDKSVAVSQRPFMSDDVLSDKRVLESYRRVAQQVGLKNAVVVPLVVGERSMGELGVANRLPRPYQERDRRLLSAVAAQIAATLDRVMLYQSADENLSRRMQELDSISRVSNELTQTLDLDRILEVIRHEAIRATGAMGSTVALLRPSSQWSEDNTPELLRRVGSNRTLEGLADIEREAALRHSVPLLVQEYEENPALQPLPASAHSAVAVAFEYADEVVGVLHVYHDEPDAFDERGANFVLTLAAKAALGYGNAMRFEDQFNRSQLLRRRVEQLNQIFELGQMLHTNTDMVTMLEAIAYSVQQSVGFDIVLMMLADEESGDLRRVAQAGLPIEVFERSRPQVLHKAHLDALLREEYRISESYFMPIENIGVWGNLGNLAALDTGFDGKRTLVGAGERDDWHDGDLLLVPLRSSIGSVLGLMVLDLPQDNHRPVQNAVEVLEIFAHQASTTIENTRLYLESIQNAEQEAQLNAVMEAIASTLNIEEILKAVARGALRLMPFMRMNAVLSRVDGGFDVINVRVNPDESLDITRETRATLENTALGRSFDDGQAYLYHADDPIIASYSDLSAWYEAGERTTMIVPLMTGGQHLGVWHLGSELAEAFGFSEFLPLIQRMANLTAVAIQNAHLFSEAVNLKAFSESIVESIQQGIIVLDKDLQIISINNFMRARYNWDDSAIGKDLFVYHPQLLPILSRSVQHTLETGDPQERSGQHLTASDKRRTSNFYIYPLGESSAGGLVIMVEDITERSQLEQDIEARAVQLAALTEVSSRITASLDYNEVINLALSEMERIIAFDTMTFWMRDGDDGLILEGAQDYQDDTIPARVRVRISSHERLNQVVETQHVHTISNLQGWDKLPGEDEAVSWMGVPLVNQGYVVGVISVSKLEPGFYDAQSEQAAFAFANQVAVALANAQLFREAERRTQRLSLLNRVSVALGQSLDSEDILEIALREIAQVLTVEHARALIFERDLQIGRVRVEHPRGDSPPDEVLDLKQSAVYQHIRRTVSSVVIPDVAQMEELEDIRQELLPRGLQSYIMIPMAIGGQVIGAFELGMYSQTRRFDPEQTDLGRIIANQAAIAIQNTSLLEQTLVRTRELETLLEAAQATSLTLDVQEVFRSVVELMMHALGMDDCLLALWDDVDNVLQIQIDVTRTGDESRVAPSGSTINLSQFPAKLQALRKREVLIVNRESEELFPGDYTALVAAGDYTHMLVPLVVRDHSIGLIQLELQSEVRTFSHRETRLAQALGSQAATAIENARLSTETANRVEELYIINDLSQAISATINIDEMIRVVRDRVPGVVGVEELYLALYDPASHVITFPLAVRNGEDYIMEPRDLNTDEVSYIIRNRRPLSMGSDYFNPDELRRSLGISAGEGDVKSYLGVPLIAGDQVVGVLALRDSQRTRAFGVNSQGILTTIASQLGAAIQNARLFDQLGALNRSLEEQVSVRTEELQQERDRIDTLYRIASELSRTLDLGRVLNRALDMVAVAVSADDGVIMQIDPTTDKLHNRAQLRRDGTTGEALDTAHPAQIIADWLVEHQERRYLVENNLSTAAYWDETRAGAQQWSSALAVLLEINDDIHGVMVLLGRRKNLFTEAHVRLVSAAANQVAAAINNSDLYYIIRDQAERLGVLLVAEQEEAEKSNAILEGIADGVVLADASGQIIRVNTAAERILELPRGSIVGRPLQRLAGPHDVASTTASWTRVIGQWQAAPMDYNPDEFLSEQLDLGNKVINVRVSPVYVEGQFLGAVLVFRDITKEVELDRMKSQFIANVSHELRTPMTSIKGYADLLLLGAAGDVSGQQEYFLKTIKSNADRLSVLVNDLLNISKIDYGNDPMTLDSVDVGPLLKSVLTTLESRSQNKALEVSLNVQPQLPAILADANKITQIFTNIIDNAFNYTYAGGSIEIEARAEDEGHVLVSVKDTGIGIPHDFRERVWERFERNDDHALVMDVAGTGLGLPIVRTLVEMHRGKVWFESEEGKGTTFYVLLPIEQPNMDAANN